MGTRERVVIVGGGITGLTLAYALGDAACRDRFEVTLLEADARLGGKVSTTREQGYVIEAGADAFVKAKPEATALCKQLGLGPRLVEVRRESRRVYALSGGKLAPMPEGLFLGVPTNAGALARTPLVSAAAKARALLDLTMRGRAPTSERDEALGAFLRRRLGAGVAEKLAEPLLGGIYAGDVEALSATATFPQLVALEREHGSLIRGARKLLAERAAAAAKAKLDPAKARETGSGSAFHGLQTGMAELVSALEAAVTLRGARVVRGARVRAVKQVTDGASRFVVESGDGPEHAYAARHVFVATPARVAAGLVAGALPELAAALREATYESAGTVTLAYREGELASLVPRDGLGVVVPRGEASRLLAVTFISNKWEGRAPPGAALLRVFVGGHRDPVALDRDDAALVALARTELEAALGIRAEPLFARVFRYPLGSPQPRPGHHAWLARVRAGAARAPGLELLGAGYDGVGIPDCVRQATDAARRLVASKP